MSMSMLRVVDFSYARGIAVNQVKRAMEGDRHVQPGIIIIIIWWRNARVPERGILLSE